MDTTSARTLGELRQTEWASQIDRPYSVRDEMRRNLVAMLENGEEPFPGIVGFHDTVLPQIENAILSKHHFILLGLRGQAKSRILRALTGLLDEKMPIVAGSEINDHPFHPISKPAKQLIEKMGDDTPIDWVDRDQRYVEKLATPDVTIADMIGDVDPIKAAKGGHLLSDELTMHYGLLPRSNRGIFAINELPDLAGKIQVGLFNILQEGDIQIKGYPIRMPLDVLMVFSANPEDYTARGKIITPLKDRIGSEILTHYPSSIEDGVSITKQEAWIDRESTAIDVPQFICELVEQVAFQAREDKRVDHRSGVSQRLPISLLEAVISNAERRSILVKEKTIVPRVSDVYAALPTITGKIELEYEGELQGSEKIAREIVKRATAATFDSHVNVNLCAAIIDWFEQGGALKMAPEERSDICLKGLGVIPDLFSTVDISGLAPKKDPATMVSASELILDGLVAKKRISLNESRGYVRAQPKPQMPPPFGHHDDLSFG